MKRLALVPLLLVTTSALGFEGEYQAGEPSGYFQTAKIEKRGANRYAASLLVTTARGCTGQIEAAGEVMDGSLILTPPGPIQCTVSISRSGQTIRVVETGCGHFHGAACGFAGSLSRK